AAPAAHRALAPFPTRRSSDPARPACEVYVWGEGSALAIVRSARRRNSRSRTPTRWSGEKGFVTNSSAPLASDRSRSSSRALAVRSEEHTSELQSPYDPVCRLL